ncbi:hypothetical protein LUZ60_012890 [Juncus effusus]|nr:hypothetical protein LUZ60_012890 [Juncus effusus]
MGTIFCCFTAEKSKNQTKFSSTTATTDSGGELSVAGTSNNVKIFPYKELRSATRNFHPTNNIGRGGFGVVYKGMLRDGSQVAIKSLSAESKQGSKEFLTEIDIISSIRHPNLVQLIGCCIEGNNRLLVYEFLENNSVASALLGSKKKRMRLDWEQRAAICVGTASGLAFLHEEAEPRIVHRDIKASNILLDENLVPKIGDFGLAKLFPDSVTHISTRVAGTMGYLAPEYALLGQLTKKADIYSFGVVVLEVVSGRSSSNSAWGHDMQSLVEWAWKLRDDERLTDLVDEDLDEYPKDAAQRFLKVALLCTQATSPSRPSMKQVVSMLTGAACLDIDVHKLVPPGIRKEEASRLPSDTRSITSAAFSTFQLNPR